STIATVFPYTTLFRSRGVNGTHDAAEPGPRLRWARAQGTNTFPFQLLRPEVRRYNHHIVLWDRAKMTRGEPAQVFSASIKPLVRSEEHTSELQSRENL